ncbi:MAG: hypothetical protein IKY34_04695 [Ruminiclostridium sp.]|nr:hypothetical protein [Ruminiclostridium sp.]
MNRDDILAFLSALFGNFLVHESLAQEITAIIERSGFEKKFFNLLLVRLRFLGEHGVNAIRHQEFESLAHTAEGLYSMHLSGKGFNVRILYAFLPAGSPVLLLAFHERSGKKVSEYQTHIPIATQRLNTILEAHDHGE